MGNETGLPGQEQVWLKKLVQKKQKREKEKERGKLKSRVCTLNVRMKTGKGRDIANDG